MKLETDNGKQAFTLMELLVVMSIMLIISTILVAGYFGMTRAASYTAAETDVFNHLQLARQRASLDGTRVFFMLIDSNSYVLVHGVGELTSDMQNGTFDAFHRFYDAYADLNIPNIKNSRVRVWNMDKNVYGNDAKTLMVTNNSVPTFPGSADKFSHISYSLDIKLPLASQYSQWKKGDRYGFELYPQLVLPKGFYFDLGTAKSLMIVFKPDGTAGQLKIGGDVDNVDTTVTIFEKITTGDKGKIKIIVQKDGTIKPG